MNAAVEYYEQRSDSTADHPKPIAQIVPTKELANNTMIGKLIDLERQQHVSKQKKEKKEQQTKKPKKDKVNTLAQLFILTANAIRKNSDNPYAETKFSWSSTISPIFETNKTTKKELKQADGEEGNDEHFEKYILNPYKMLEEIIQSNIKSTKSTKNYHVKASLKQKDASERACRQQSLLSNVNMKEHSRSLHRPAIKSVEDFEHFPRNFQSYQCKPRLKKDRKFRQASQSKPIHHMSPSVRSCTSNTDMTLREGGSDKKSVKAKIKLGKARGVGPLTRREKGGEIRQPANSALRSAKYTKGTNKNEFSELQDENVSFYPNLSMKKPSTGKAMKQSVKRLGRKPTNRKETTLRKKKQEPFILHVNPNKNRDLPPSASKAPNFERKKLNRSRKRNFSSKYGVSMPTATAKRSMHSELPIRSFMKVVKGEEPLPAFDDNVKVRKNPWFVPRNSPTSVATENANKIRGRKKRACSEATKEKHVGPYAEATKAKLFSDCAERKTKRQKWLEILESVLKFPNEFSEADQEATSRSFISSSKSTPVKKNVKRPLQKQRSRSAGDTISKISDLERTDDDSSSSMDELYFRMPHQEAHQEATSRSSISSSKSAPVKQNVKRPLQKQRSRSAGDTISKISDDDDTSFSMNELYFRMPEKHQKMNSSTNMRTAKSSQITEGLENFMRNPEGHCKLGKKEARKDPSTTQLTTNEENYLRRTSPRAQKEPSVHMEKVDCSLDEDRQSFSKSYTSSSIWIGSEASDTKLLETDKNSKLSWQEEKYDIAYQPGQQEHCSETMQEEYENSIICQKSNIEENCSSIATKESTGKLSYDEKYAQAMVSIIRLKGMPLGLTTTKDESQSKATPSNTETGDNNDSSITSATPLSPAKDETNCKCISDICLPCRCSYCLITEETGTPAISEAPKNNASSTLEAKVRLNTDIWSQIDIQFATTSSKTKKITLFNKKPESSVQEDEVCCFSDNYPSINDFLTAGTPNLSETEDSFIYLISKDAIPSQTGCSQCCSCKNELPSKQTAEIFDSEEKVGPLNKQDMILQQPEDVPDVPLTPTSIYTDWVTPYSSITTGFKSEKPRKLPQHGPYSASSSNDDPMYSAKDYDEHSFEIEGKEQRVQCPVKLGGNVESEMDFDSFSSTEQRKARNLQLQNSKPSCSSVWCTSDTTSIEHVPVTFRFDVQEIDESSDSFEVSTERCEPGQLGYSHSLMSEQLPKSPLNTNIATTNVHKSSKENEGAHACLDMFKESKNLRSTDTLPFVSCAPSEGEELLDDSDYYLSVQEELVSLAAKNKQPMKTSHKAYVPEKHFRPRSSATLPLQPNITVEKPKEQATPQLSPAQITAVLGSKATYGVSKLPANTLAGMFNSFLKMSHAKEKQIAGAPNKAKYVRQSESEDEFFSFSDTEKASKFTSSEIPPQLKFTPPVPDHMKTKTTGISPAMQRIVKFQNADLKKETARNAGNNQTSLKLKVHSLQRLLVYLVTKHPELKPKILAHMADHHPNLLSELFIDQLLD